VKLTEFAEKYLARKGITLLPWQRQVLECVERGERVHITGGRNGKQVMNTATIIREYEKEKEKERLLATNRRVVISPEGKLRLIDSHDTNRNRIAINSSIQGSSGEIVLDTELEQEPAWDTGIIIDAEKELFKSCGVPAVYVGVDVGEPGGDKTAVIRCKGKDGKMHVVSCDLYDEEESRI
jgi:hypothetical protein